MTLVENLYVNALDLGVSAVVHAPAPVEAPSITSPSNNAVLTSSNVTVSGSCPIATPEVIVSIYKGTTLLGSTTCTADGAYSVTITLGYGKHTLLARVVTITGDIGSDSPSITVTRTASKPSPSPTSSPTPPSTSGPQVSAGLLEFFPQLITKDNFAIVRPPADSDGTNKNEGEVVWKFSIKGGELPYTVQIDWGDGAVETFKVASRKEREYIHIYGTLGTYTIKVKVVDAKGRESYFTTIATTQAYRTDAPSLALDSHFESIPPIVAFMQQYMFQIYIAAFSALLFLWYLEHARHIHRTMRR